LATILKTFSLLNKNTNLSASDKKLKFALKCKTSFDTFCLRSAYNGHCITILQIEQLMFDKYKLDWKNRVSAYSQGNKLRTYKLFKRDFYTEPYLEYKIPLKYRRIKS
jgi:hypothetical protein